MEYKGMIEDVGALARFFTGWSRADLFGLSVRERRYWIRQAAYVIRQQERSQNGR